MKSKASQLSFPLWYTFLKWLFPIVVAGLAAWAGLCILGLLSVPAHLLVAEFALPLAIGLFLLDSLITRGMLLPVAEKVAEHREIHLEHGDIARQSKEEELLLRIHECERALVEEGDRHAKLSMEYNKLLGHKEVLRFTPRPSSDGLPPIEISNNADAANVALDKEPQEQGPSVTMSPRQ